MRGMTWAMSRLILGNGLMPALAQPAEAAPQKLQETWSATSAGTRRQGSRWRQIFASYQNQTCMVFVRRRRWVSFRSGSLVAMLVAAFAYPAAASAQKDKVQRVAFVASTLPPTEVRASPYVLAFVSRLRELGYVEGRNLTLDFRTLEGRFERIPEILTDIVRLKPDVIFTATQLVGERHLQALVFVVDETLIVASAAMDLVMSGPVFAAGVGLWAASLILVRTECHACLG